MVAALVLAAGLGTRLAPLSSWRAKPLVPIGDRPAIARIVAQVRRVSRVVVVNAYHRAGDVEAYAREAGVVVSREEELLGTAGGLARAATLLGTGDVLVWNGDMIGELDLDALLAAHATSVAQGALATLVVKPRSAGDRGGNVGLDLGGDVVRIRRETCREGEVRTADFLGIYLVGDAIRGRLPARGDVIAEGFLPAIRAGGRVCAFATEAELLDVGTPAAYLEANLRWLASRGLDSWTGEGVRVDAGVELAQSVVGAGARVTGSGRLERCVVWPGGETNAPDADAIVAAEGVVRVHAKTA
jgi:mannose-1-phosphate guanylyltransferase